MRSQQDIIDSLPVHLRPFVAYQDYHRYTPRDHAVWRFLMHQLKHNLSSSAHPVYLEGLQRTGITTEAIPRIEEMNQCLEQLGWRALVVDGFVPPAIFMEFQAHRVLPVAVAMRSMAHMLYTPAPDIVHESAGHAPFIVDIDYAEFLQRFGELGMRAIATKEDMHVYHAIRRLSIVKEAAVSTPEEIKAAESALSSALSANDPPSEAALLARLHWWTVEYGLVGEIDDYKIFGAGLLSSLGESVNCLDDRRVKKIPLTVDAINTSYDITTEQPQLFVTKSCRHLTQVLEEFGRKMCVSVGGAQSIEKAVQAGTVNTAVMNSGIEISGTFSRVIKDAVGNAIYLNTDGPSQLSYRGVELPGQGTQYHASGFGCPVGRLKVFNRCLSDYTIDELKLHEVEIGKRVILEFLSGITVHGNLTAIVRRDHKNLLLSFVQCRVTDLSGKLLFEPSWGIYDMAVGDQVVSVYGGSADKQRFPLHEAPSSQTTSSPQYNATTRKLFLLYRQIRQLREQPGELQSLKTLPAEIHDPGCDEWLLQFEALELLLQRGAASAQVQGIIERLQQLAVESGEEASRLIRYGLARLELPEKSRQLSY